VGSTETIFLNIDMKRFFNVYTGAMLAVTVIAVLAAVLSTPINWLGVVWMVIAAMWVVTARSNQLTAEDWKQLYGTQSNAFNTLRQRWNSTIDELVELRGKYQALDDEYLKLAKQHNAQGEELAKLKRGYDGLEAKKTQSKTTRKKKEDYTDQEKARIKNEMKAGGLIKDED